MAGLSPAAKLARQHTLRSNAEAAARAKASQDVKGTQSTAPGSVPTWERDTARREVNNPLRTRGNVDESGRRLSTHSRSYSDEGSEDGSSLGHVHQRFIAEENDFLDQDDEDLDDGEVTVRHDSFEIEVEPWAIGVRRSVERTRAPSRGILKSRFYSIFHFVFDSDNRCFCIETVPRITKRMISCSAEAIRSPVIVQTPVTLSRPIII